MSQPYVGGITETVTRSFASSLTAGQIRQTLSAPWPAPAEGAAPAGHGTHRNADPYSARYPDCPNPTGAAAEARQLLGRWAE